MKKILVIAPSWVGDSVMAQPLYSRLQERYPDLNLHVFAPPTTLPLLARMPNPLFVHPNPFAHGRVSVWQRWKIGRAFAQERFTQMIVLPNSFKSALVAFFSTAPLRTGFIGEARYGLLNDSRKLDTQQLPTMLERFSALAEDPGQMPQRPIPYPRLTSKLAQQQATLKHFNLDTRQAIIGFCPGAEYGPAKRWPARHFAALAQRFQQAGFAVWLLGSSKDSELGREIAALSQHAAINLCGATQLDEVIDLLALTMLVVCNDSGLMHIAAALDKPLLALYGSSSPDFTPPLSNKATILSLKLDCSPCFKRHCPYQHTDCLEKLSPQYVWEAAQALLEDRAQKTEDR